MQFENPIVGTEDLIRPAIKSPNYSPGSSGWRIAADGSAEFTGLVINSDGVFGTITIEDGEIVVRRNSDNEIVAKMYTTGTGVGGILSRDPDSPDLEFAELTANYLRFNRESTPAEVDGRVGWFNGAFDVGTQIASGYSGAGELGANIYAVSSTSGLLPPDLPSVVITGDSNGECPLYVNGDVHLRNTGGGSDEHSLILNDLDIGRGPRDWNVFTVSTGTVTTTETIGYTSNVTLLKEDRAFRIHLRLRVTSDTANDVVRVRVRRTDLAGITLLDTLSTAQIPGVGVSVVLDQEVTVVNDTGSDVTDQLVITYHRVAGAGNVNIVASVANAAILEVHDKGSRFNYTGALGI